mmetsp:Transcript_18480/g.52300  ORF Transcript_18480/g.52300 Transcript_18480/m.52300 type:complete len:118 (-) Transcript_18480:90-443(-)
MRRALWELVLAAGVAGALTIPEDVGGGGDHGVDLKAAVRAMAEVDTDGDGKISLEEFLPAVGAPADDKGALRIGRKMFARADEDGDGAISVDELPSLVRHFNSIHDMMDEDEDGEEL